MELSGIRPYEWDIRLTMGQTTSAMACDRKKRKILGRGTGSEEWPLMHVIQSLKVKYQTINLLQVRTLDLISQMEWSYKGRPRRRHKDIH